MRGGGFALSSSSATSAGVRSMIASTVSIAENGLAGALRVATLRDLQIGKGYAIARLAHPWPKAASEAHQAGIHVLRCCFARRSTAATISLGEQGFSKTTSNKSGWLRPISACAAVKRTIGILEITCEGSARTARARSSPVMIGIMKSVTMTSGRRSEISRNPASPSAAVRTSSPSAVSTNARASAFMVSSSMTTTVAMILRPPRALGHWGMRCRRLCRPYRQG